MAGSVNKVILVGNLGKDPESRSFQNGGKVAELLVGRRAEEPGADIAAIRELSLGYVTHVLGRDWPKWSASYADDAIFLVPNEPALAGRSGGAHDG